MVKANTPFWQEGKKIRSNMRTAPGDYRPESKVAQDYGKLMSKESIKRDVQTEALSPKTFGMKRRAKQTGGFKGFKI